jgi:hypothetical protein
VVKVLATELKAVDISNVPELLRIVEEVRATNEPRILRRASEDLAILTPAKPGRRWRIGRGKTQTDCEAFRSAVGGWKDVETDKLIADIYADRALSDRPLAEL